MTMHDDFDRMLSVWLDESAGTGMPDYLDETLDGIGRISQRPAWMSPWRWLPMQLTMPRVHIPGALAVLGLIALLIAAIVAAALLIGSQRRLLPAPIGPAANGLFVFDSGGDIIVTNTSGSGRRVLAGSEAVEFGPAFAPDGRHIAFWTRTGPGEQAALVVADESGASRQVIATGITPDQRDSAPAWSPDGRILAFVGEGGILERVRADGTDRLRLGSDQRGRFYPRWSPDGHRLAFVVGAYTGGVMHVIDADGTNETKVGTQIGGLADWSHDGETLYYFAPVEPGDLIKATFDGASWTETVLLGGDRDDVAPRLSNDGTRLAFLRLDGGAGSVMVMGVDDTQPTAVTGEINGLTFAIPCWSPDDRFIAALTLGADPAFVVVPVDGSSIQRIPAVGVTSFDACNWQRVAP